MRENQVTLQLNRAALDRLLGGDTQLEIDLRQQVVNEFTKKHLKEIVNTAGYKAATEIALAAINRELKAELATYVEEKVAFFKSESVYNVKQQLENLINKIAKEKVDKIIMEKMGEYEKHWGEYIDRRVKAVFDINISNLVQERMSELKKKLVNVLQ